MLCLSIAKTSWLMLFKVMIAVGLKIEWNPINTMCENTRVVFLSVREGDTHNCHCAYGVLITDFVTIFMF
jgi:hypothetical protein